MHPLPKIDGCSCTRCTRSNEGPVSYFAYLLLKLKLPNWTNFDENAQLHSGERAVVISSSRLPAQEDQSTLLVLINFMLD